MGVLPKGGGGRDAIVGCGEGRVEEVERVWAKVGDLMGGVR